MFSPTNLCRSRHNIYYFRLRLPFKSAGGTPVYTKVSLNTREPQQALQLARMLEYHSSLVLTDHRTALMTNDEIKELVRRYCENILKTRKHQIQANGPLADEAVLGLHKALEDHATMKTLSGIIVDDSNTMAAVMDSLGLAFAPGSADYRMLQSNYRLAYPMAIEALLKFNNGRILFDFSDPASAVPLPISSIEAEDNLTIRSLVDQYMKLHVADRGWNRKTSDERQAIYEVLCEILGDSFSVRKINAKLSREVRDTLLRLPRNRNKNPKVRGLNLQDALNAEAKTLSSRSINKYLKAFVSLFSWAENEGYVDRNYFKTLHGKSESKDKLERLPFTPEQIVAMKTVLADPAHTLRNKEYRYWGTLLGMFTGGRLNEVAQIMLDDIKQKDGVWFIDMNDEGEGQRLKNDASRRFVPIHQTLLNLGLIEYRDTLKRQGKTRLLHEMRYEEKNGYGKKLGHFFNEVFLPRLEMKTPQTVFHSFRHTAISRMLQAGEEYPVIQSIVGHELSGTAMTTYFAEGYTLPRLKATMDKLHPDFPSLVG